MLIEETSQFSIAWSQSFSDLNEVLALRKSCFPGVRDILSPADLRAHHLMIRDGNRRLVGTYRVTLSTDVSNFETEDDFEILQLLQREGVKAELSWACVDQAIETAK